LKKGGFKMEKENIELTDKELDALLDDESKFEGVEAEYKRLKKIKNGKRNKKIKKFVLIATIALAATAIGTYAVKKYISKPKSITMENNDEKSLVDEIRKEMALQSTVRSSLTDYYINNTDKYPYSFEELMANQISYLTAEEIEDIYGLDVPTQKKLEKYLASFYTKAQYNASYMVSGEGLIVPVNNVEEAAIAKKLEKKMASINANEMNDTITEEDVESLKGLIYDTLDADYSNGLKGYVVNVILPALSNVADNVGYPFTDAETEKNGEYQEKNYCAVLASQFVENRDRAININGVESAEFGDPVGEDSFITELKISIKGLDDYPSKFAAAKDMKFREPGTVLKGTSEGSKEENNYSNDNKVSSAKDSNNKEVETNKSNKTNTNKSIKSTKKVLEKRADVAVQAIVDNINEYLVNFISVDGTIPEDSMKALKNLIKIPATKVDNHYNYDGKLKAAIIEAFYDEDGKKTDAYKRVITNAVISGLTKYNKKGGISTEMVANLERILGVKLSEKIGKAGLIIGVTKVRDTDKANTYHEKDTYTKSGDEFLLDSNNFLQFTDGTYITVTVNGKSSLLHLDSSYRIVDEFGNIYTLDKEGNILDKNNVIVVENKRTVATNGNTTNNATTNDNASSSNSGHTDENGITWYDIDPNGQDFTAPQKTY
jgi:hypothetical protein